MRGTSTRMNKYIGEMYVSPRFATATNKQDATKGQANLPNRKRNVR